MENSVELSDGESVELEDEIKDVRDESSKDVGPKGKRKNASDAKEHFKDIEGKYKGKMVKKKQCIYCNHSYVANSSGTTTSLTRHLKDCTYFHKAQGNSKGFINFGSNRSDKTVFIDEESSGGFNPMKVRELIAKMNIGRELPVSVVDYHWFNQLCKYLNPLFQKVSRSTITRDCIKVVNVEKERIKKILKKADMISLISDCWTSNQTIGYMCLTAHFVDSDWKLQKFIIGFNELAPPHSGEVISDGILECLIKWGIQDKVGTITLDNASNNDKAAMFLKNNFQGKGKLHFEGLFFHVRCCAHILNLVVQDGLVTIEACLLKIREGVKYLRKSSGRLLRFGEIAISLGISTHRSLCTDVKTRWNSMHRMLESAIHYKRAFQGYALRDSNFVWSPTSDECNRAEKVCKLLEVSY